MGLGGYRVRGEREARIALRRPARNDGIFEFEPTEKGTNVKFTMDYDLPYSILGVILDKLIVSKDVEKNIEEGLQKMKEILEK